MSQNLDTHTIYEIFRACRLCGAGGGYKMPIIPSVVGFDCADIELRQKIRECVQIEVNQDDKMPPLICELCVDKVNDFYEFLAMCRDTNTKTRQRLGLPEPYPFEGDNCILGVTEPVFVQDDDDLPLSRRTTRMLLKVKKEDKKNDKNKGKERVKSLTQALENLIKQENTSSRDSRSSCGEKRLDSSSSSRSSRNRISPTPPARETRQSITNDKDISLSRLKVQQNRNETPKTKSILKQEKEEIVSIDSDDDIEDVVPVAASKRARDKAEKDAKDTPNKRIKLTIKLPPREPTPPKAKPRPGPKCSKRAESPPKILNHPAPGPKSSKPGPKSSKPGPKSSKIVPTPAPVAKSGPKSSKHPPSPIPKPSKRGTYPTTNSVKRSASPTPKLLKRGASPTPKPLKRGASPISKPVKRGASPIPKQLRRGASPTPKPLKRGGSPITKPLKRGASPTPKLLKHGASPTTKSVKRGASPIPKSSKRVSSPAPEHVCSICASVFHSPQGYSSHLRSQHTVKYTPNELACNPCGEWFSTPEEVTAHHKQHKNKHKPYKCRGCRKHYRLLNEYNQHIAETSCVPWTEVPDVKCADCWKEFPTDNIREEHRCGGKDARPGGKCSKCNKSYQTLKTLKKHESTCTSKKKAASPLSSVKMPPHVRARLRAARVRVARCDQLLAADERGRYHVATLPADFGLDPRCVYPYRAIVRVKQEPLAADRMVSINKDVRDEFYKEEDYVHWDSDNSTSSDEEFSFVTPTHKKKRVPSLTALALKTIFSRQCLGKVPKKLRKVRTEKFDSFYNPETEFDDVQDDINDIINNLGDDDDKEVSGSGFSVKDIKLIDVKSISEPVMSRDGVNIDIEDINSSTNYESDSLLQDNQQSVASQEKVEFDELKTKENLNIEQNLSNNLVNNIKNLNVENGSETDASLDDSKSESQSTEQIDEKSTASEISQDLDIATTNNYENKTNNYENKTNNFENLTNNFENLTNNFENTTTNSENTTNGKSLATEVTVEKSNGAIEHHSDLINDINELYDKTLMDELDAQIGEKEVNMAEKADADKILLEDLVPNKNCSVSGLDALSDEEFNFDA